MKPEELLNYKVLGKDDVVQLHDAMEQEGAWAWSEQSGQSREDYLDDLGYTVDEVDSIKALYDEVKHYHGATIIASDYFEDYACQQAVELGFVQKDSPVYDHVDWEEYAVSVGRDYHELDTPEGNFQVRVH